MPEWTIHDKWAQIMGIPSEASTYVNSLIDFPGDCPRYLDFCAEITKWSDYFDDKDSKYPFTARQLRNLGRLQDQLQELLRDSPDKFARLVCIGHDSSRSDRNRGLQAHIQKKFLAPKGALYIRAWYLHHILDYLESDADMFTPDEIFKRLSDRTGFSAEFAIVEGFVRGHWAEILRDLRRDQ